MRGSRHYARTAYLLSRIQRRERERWAWRTFKAALVVAALAWVWLPRWAA